MIVEATAQWNLRERQLVDYLVSLKEEAEIVSRRSDILFKSLGLWQKLRAGVLTTYHRILEVPDCCPSSYDFHIMFTWDKEEHYLECEVMIDGTFEMFYRNRLTKEDWGEDYLQNPDNFLDYPELWEKLSLFVE